MVLQLYESFSLGYTFGLFKTFSVVFSITMFQFSSAQLLPDLLDDLPKRLKENKIMHSVTCYLIVIMVWLLPYAVASIPFLVFFHPNRQEYFDAHGFHGIDWDKDTQSIILNINCLLIGGYLSYLLYALKNLRNN